MGTGISAGSGGGIHPGAPIIWPTSKNKQTIQEVTSSEEAQASNRSVSSSQSSAASAAQTASSAAAMPAPAQPQTPISRQMSMADINAQLTALSLSLTSENKQLASLMLSYGVELSSENFDAVFKLTKGKADATTFESAVIGLTKGLPDSKKSVDFLASFFARNQDFANQLQQMRQEFMAFQKALQHSSILNSTLTNGVASVIQDLDVELRKLLKKSTDESVTLPKVDRGELVSSLKAFHQLLGGLEKQLTAQNNPQNSEVLKHLQTLQSQIEESLSQFVAQSILSKEAVRQHSDIKDAYEFWQIPNPLVQHPSLIDILIKKDPYRQKRKIDPRKTKIILKLETPDLGELAIIVVVLDQKVWYIFNAEDEGTKNLVISQKMALKQQMDAIQYNLIGFQSLKKKIDIKKYLLPTLNLDSVKRIDAQI